MNKIIYQNSRLLALCLGCFFLSWHVNSQDIHFTNYRFAPLSLNPAKTGHFVGSYRVGAIYRSQFSSFIAKPYQTPSIYIDAPLNMGLAKNHWVGAGISLFADRAGDLALQNFGLFANLAYHIGFDNQYKNVVSLGIQSGFVQVSFPGSSKAVLGDEFVKGSANSPDRSKITDFKGSFQDYSGGLQFRNTGKNVFTIGAAMYHINKPSLTLNQGQQANAIDPKLMGHASYRMKTSDKIEIEPIIYYTTETKYKNISAQALAHISLHKAGTDKKDIADDKKTVLTLGLGYRLSDALQAIIEMEYKAWKFGIAYDMTISDAADYTNSFGAIEFGLSRAFVVTKKPKVPPIIFCPRF